MSFITKRERVFHECDLFDLPARNEGKLKAFGSCTDARAWSHFGSDKTEHLVNIIRRNNDMCHPKYVPTDVIVNTLMGVKNSEIVRLKRKIAEFEQMLAAYDDLDLTEEQKCEIANAHEAIRAANADLHDLIVDLDLTGFTEGIDSDTYETGKSAGDMSERSRGDERGQSRGDQWPSTERVCGPKMQSKGNQKEVTWTNEIGTNITDPRIDDMEETIIVKDAKLNAMRNTIAVMENDVCEPYCLYAHIYTALEKIFAILCQNAEYKKYLDLLSLCNKNTGNIDIKGKILLKLKVLEKFSIALIAPCTKKTRNVEQDCACYYAQINTGAYALTSSELKHPMNLENKRAQLIADIMENDDIKNVYSTSSMKDEKNQHEESQPTEGFILDNYSIDSENLNRLKNLQSNYDDLMICYENLKLERDRLQNRCKDYDAMESEVEHLQHMLKEYNTVWNEKEHFKRRSEDLNSLKEQFMVLSEETLNLEGQLKAESEINSMKASKISNLTAENIDLEKRINDITIAFEKEKNTLECKIKETECKVMCQEQQIKSMSIQIDRLLEQDNKVDLDNNSQIYLLNEIECLKQEINNLKGVVDCNEEENERLQEQFKKNLVDINDLRMEIEEWKTSYEKLDERNEYLEKYLQESRDELNKLAKINQDLSNDLGERATAVENIRSIITNKSEECEKKEIENNMLREQLQEMQNLYKDEIESLEGEKGEVLQDLQLARQKSEQILQKIKNYDEVVSENDKMKSSIISQNKKIKDVENILMETIEKNTKLQKQLENQKLTESKLSLELQEISNSNKNIADNAKSLIVERDEYRSNLDNVKKEFIMLEKQMSQHEITSKQLQKLQINHDSIVKEKQILEHKYKDKSLELHSTKQELEISRKNSEIILQKSEVSLNAINDSYQKCLNEKLTTDKYISKKNEELDILTRSYDKLKLENQALSKLNIDLKNQTDIYEKKINQILNENLLLQNKFDSCTNENDQLTTSLERINEENILLQKKITSLDLHQKSVLESLSTLASESISAKASISSIKTENDELKDNLNKYRDTEEKLKLMKRDFAQLKTQNSNLKQEYELLSSECRELKKVNHDLDEQTKDLTSHKEILENNLIQARDELISHNHVTGGTLSKIFEELEDMKKEKILKQNKIRELSDRLDEDDFVITNLKQVVAAREDKISILENHINELEEEVKRLHDNFAALIETSEEIKDNSFQKIDQSIKNVETHHSQATQNMKMEIAELQKSNSLLEHQLSIINVKSQESMQDKSKLVSQLIQSENEKNSLLQQLQLLEIATLGKSFISPDNCNTEDVIHTFEKIRNSLDVSLSKSSSLEKTLLNVQTSSQLLQSKTDEAKKIAENEKQKIMNEKEEVVRDKIKMENQLQKLKDDLNKQILHDQIIIKDLESELLNKSLIIENLDKSNQDIISKLKNDLKNVQELYQNVIENCDLLKKQVHSLTLDNNNKNLIIENSSSVLKQKMQEVQELRTTLESMEHITKDEQIQTNHYNIHEVGVQTEVIYDVLQSSTDTGNASSYANVEQDTYKHSRNNNEIQVLTAATKPSYDFVRNNYLNYKLKQLSVGPLKVDSIIDDDSNTESYKNITNSEEQSSSEPKVIKVFDRPSQLRTNSLQTKTDDINTSTVSNMYLGSENTDKDLLVMYKGSQNTYGPFDIEVTHYNHQESQESSPLNIQNTTDENLLNDETVTTLRQAKLKISSKSKTKTDIIFSHSKDNLPSPTIDRQFYLSSQRIFYSDEKLNRSHNADELLPQSTVSLFRLSDENLIKNIGEKYKQKNQTRKITDRNLFNIKTALAQQPKLANENVKNNIIMESEIGLTSSLHSLISKDNNVLPSKEIIKFEDRYSLTSPSGNDDEEKIYNLYENKDIISNEQHSSYTMHKSSLQSYSVKKRSSNKGVLAKIDNCTNQYYEEKIRSLSNSLEVVEKEYKNKCDAIKLQYDNNIKKFINKHNLGVQSIQSLHEETLQDILKSHENEVDNLRTLSIEAMKKADKYDKENKVLKNKLLELNNVDVNEEPTNILSRSTKKRKSKQRVEMKNLTKTNVHAINVQGEPRQTGPCTCSLDVTLSESIRNIFEQVDVRLRKTAENKYIKYIADKLTKNSMESLAAQELSFLHLKVCRTWKQKISKEEALQLHCINKKHSAQQHIANLDRMMKEEKDRLQFLGDALSQSVSKASPDPSPDRTIINIPIVEPSPVLLKPSPIAMEPQINNQSCMCPADPLINERGSSGSGDLADVQPMAATRPRRMRPDSSNRAILVKLEPDNRKVKRAYHDDPPIKLRRSHDRSQGKTNKK